MNDRRVVAIYVLSGACGLIYEVVWSRLLALSVGAEATAVTAVLAAFMGGLALGAHLGGRLARKCTSPLRDYGRIELALGLVCLIVPAAIRALSPLLASAYAAFGPSLAFHVVRALLCGLVLVVPTTLMGATLPILARGGKAGALYAANTFGAVLGALLAGFVLVPSLGVAATNTLAALGSLTVGAAAIALGRGLAAPEEPPSEKARSTRLPLLGFALSGAAAMTFQLAWTRAFAIVLGPTTYSFSVMLAAYILGHAIGSQRAAARAEKLVHPLEILGVLISLAAVTALGVVPLVDWAPVYLVPTINKTASSFALHALTQFALAFAFVAIPAGLFGTAFALVTRRAAPGPAYAANSLGAVLGTLLGALLIPGIGIGRTLAAGAVLAAVAASVFALASEGQRARNFVLALAIMTACTATLLPRWEPLRLNSGAYLYGLTGSVTGGATSDETLVYREGFSGAVLVARSHASGSLYLKIDGKVDAGTGAEDMRTQLLLGHLPCLVAREKPRRALVVGLGSGVTLRAVLAEDVPEVDLVEIEPVLVEAVRATPLHEVSRRALDAKGVRVLVADARAVYALERKSYDVIVSEPSNPWIAGVGNLFTKEAFALARERLAPGGVFCQWVHAGYASAETFKLVARTFLEVFPRASLFEVAPDTDYLLVAAREGDLGEGHEERFTPAVARDLELLELESARDVVAFHRALGPSELARFAGPGPVNTDDSACLEFLAPRAVTAHLDLLHDPDFARLREKGFTGRDDALAALAGTRPEGMSHEDAWATLDRVEHALTEDGHGAARPLLRLAVAEAIAGARDRGVAPADLVDRGTRLLEVLWTGGPPTRFGTPEDERELGVDFRNLAAHPSYVGDLMELGKLLLRARGDRAAARKAVAVAYETDPSQPVVRGALMGLER